MYARLLIFYELPQRMYWQKTYNREELRASLATWAGNPNIDITRRSNPEEIWIHDASRETGLSWILVMPSSLAAEMVFRLWEELRR